MEKVIRDNQVAVLYSPGFGAGWSTWNTENESMLYHPMIVDIVLSNEDDWQVKAEALASLIWPDAYLGGLQDLAVKWIPIGTLFKINEYDGSESIEYKESSGWSIA
jgi:hypothetical protein